MTPALLGLIGLLLAHPVPALLGRTAWPYRSPRAGVVLWQSLAIAAVLAVLGAGLSTALWLVTSGRLTPVRVVVHFAVLALTAVITARLAWSLVSVARETRARRARHRELVDLLGDVDGAVPTLRILAEQTPVAYCLPGLRKVRVIVSRGALDRLAADELDAVLEHERAHVRARHDLVLEGFTALRRAFPHANRSDAALRQTQIMVELLADDAARRRHGVLALARALVTLAEAPTPGGALGAGTATEIRLRRLESAGASPRGAAVAAVACYLLAAVVLVVPTVSLAVPWILTAWASLS